MSDFVRPVVVCSKCLEFDNCRYNGAMISEELVRAMKPHVDFSPVCPECEIGLGAPRRPVRIVSRDDEMRLVQLETEDDVTDRMLAFAASFLGGIGEPEGFILKGRSPSCGPSNVKVYRDTGKSAPAGKTAGLFARAVAERFPDVIIEEEGRLKNAEIREHFLTHIFACARLRGLKARGSMGTLVRFQAQNKLLLMAYNQQELRALGPIVANHEGRPFDEVIADYEAHFRAALARPAGRRPNVNVLMHGLGYFSEHMSAEEKAFFLRTLDEYRAGDLPLSVPVYLLRSFIVRWNEEYLLHQTFFNPYPEELRLQKDSGKGRPGSVG
jgi:uncharacterized protein YbgA (DUF1722 family)/uncharacterized protein YbbK (DUF523 family)